MKSKQRLATLSSALVTFLIIALFVYQSLQKSASTANPPPAGAAPASPTADARPSLTPASATAQPGGKKAGFDFYVLNLSWSPDYCASSGSDDPQQCSLGKKLGFVLHGLWPQYNQGWPEYCAYLKLSPNVKAEFPNLYPSASLYDHEWDKHGTCSGLTPEGYLSLSKRLRDSVAIPAAYKAPDQPVRVTTVQLKKDFVAANPALTEASLAVYCSGSGRFLSELYVCFSSEGKPQACSQEIHGKAAKSCGGPDLLVRNVR